MRPLILDIETVGEEWTTLDETTQTMLGRYIEQTTKSDEERQWRYQELKTGLGFSPLTGSIVALGVYDVMRATGTVYYVGGDATEETSEGQFFYKPRSEAELLTAFWDGVTHYDAVVTFNGRAFDLPFILHRSIVHAVLPSVDLLRYRYLTQQAPPYHIDLQDQLTFYGAMSRRPNLHLFCRAYGIVSPKVDGVCGDDVTTLFREGRFRDIAAYNERDLMATAALFTKWCTYLAPPAWRDVDAIDF